jgi:hypothetical protein
MEAGDYREFYGVDQKTISQKKFNFEKKLKYEVRKKNDVR